MNARMRCSSACVASVRSNAFFIEPWIIKAGLTFTMACDMLRHLLEATTPKEAKDFTARTFIDFRAFALAAAELGQQRLPGNAPKQLCVHCGKDQLPVKPS